MTRTPRPDARPKDRILAALAAALLLAGLLPPPARASVEEFSTFHIARQERDDESLLDHFLTRMPRAWRDEWSRTAAGFRTSQGCLTSGLWFLDTDFKARAPMGERAWFGVELFQSESDIIGVQNLDLSFHFPQPVGSAFAMYRPGPVKAAQDFALGWEAGSDTSRAWFRATWTIEDIFNNFWGFRQTQTGNLLEPYERRPYEPAVAFAVRRPDWRVEAGAKWLTPSRARITDIDSRPFFLRELWGAAGQARVERRVGAFTIEARTEHRQARGREIALAPGYVDRLDYRRQWSAEAAARTAFREGRTEVETRWLYQSRTEFAGPPVGTSYLQIDDRFLNLDVTHAFRPSIEARTGVSYARVGVARENPADHSYGTRSESRFYVGLALKLGRIRVAGVEGVELDDEPYDVRIVHDKGFLQLQTTF